MRSSKDIAQDQQDMADEAVYQVGGAVPAMGAAAPALMRQKLQRRPRMPRMRDYPTRAPAGMPRMAGGGSVSSASARADGCAQKGKTKGRMV